MRYYHEKAVSPVVGVMLMLVVTIIIAAVVSAFSGGLVKSTDKAPQLTISGEYSISEGLSISHDGGDPVGTRTTFINLLNGKSFGSGGYMQYELNKSQITDISGKTAWISTSGMSGIKTFAAGDTLYVLPPYHEGSWLQSTVSKASWYNKTANIGKTIVVEMRDENGHVFAKTEIPVTA